MSADDPHLRCAVLGPAAAARCACRCVVLTSDWVGCKSVASCRGRGMCGARCNEGYLQLQLLLLLCRLCECECGNEEAKSEQHAGAQQREFECSRGWRDGGGGSGECIGFCHVRVLTWMRAAGGGTMQRERFTREQ